MTEYQVVPIDEMKAFITRTMVAIGTRESHAEMLADNLVVADYRGHFSHGLNRIYCYIKDIQEGTISFDENPKIIKESAATALVDGMNLLGPIVGNFCMDLAIKKAKEAGIGIVVATKSNHYGIAGYYAIQALKENMIGLSFTNASPKVFPTRSKASVFGTNPISFAAPGNNGDSFVLDMATSAVAYGKVEINHRKNLPIPDGWAVDENGEPTTDALKVMGNGGLLPLGGVEVSSGYKGYGLGFMVEILCGILAASNYGPNIREWKDSGFANLGQCFIAINPGNFADGFNDRLQGLMDHCRNMEPSDPSKPVLVAGDPEREHMNKCEQHGGIAYHCNQIKYANELANELKVAPPRVISSFKV